ncbi:SP0191 family lipoprotein [Streptococcus sp. sy004]|uniref:SP0191 family lipoprotein n=1 Tax=Streptococcus sp. sy004 TaxID=2600149 RepID=UPI00164691D2|nr:SP0191 family lipoprotein [Streptococcus sp. sy004]
MKKIFLPLLVLLSFFMVSCSQEANTTKSNPTPSSSEVTKLEKVVTETYQYQEDLDGQLKTMTETITYQGEQFLSLDLLIEEPLDEETQAILAEQDFANIKDEIIRQIENDSSFSKLKSLKGVTTSLDLRDDYVFVVRVIIDMQVVDFDQLLQVPGLPETFADFKVLKPQDYIISLIAQGATQLKE